ncbi:MAG: hypothetical protein KAK00_02820 [Nanoarchaeota archaeon]|nr:hypothetical protein [Nanoarchaeota archaeon]
MAKAKKTKKNLQKDKKEEFFVALNNCEPIRVELLESTKMILESMKIFQELKGIRIRKIEEKNKLRKQIRAISSTMSRIKSELPVINIPEEAVSPKLPIKETPPVEQPKKEAPPQKTELDRIEDELREIEGKLSGFN